LNIISLIRNLPKLLKPIRSNKAAIYDSECHGADGSFTGAFALSSLMIEQKLKDVAIRKTLGASDHTLVFGLTRQFLWIAVIAVLISIPICYYLMNEWLKDFAYRIDMPVWPFIVSF
jgi:ABC-type antimicrobial peptide transport system permease subunit